MDRYLEKQIVKDLERKMVFIVGPRQVGKTWLAKKIAENHTNTLYINYDNPDDRMVVKNQSWFPNEDLIIFDEIYKMPSWKNYLKGVYDTKPENQKIIVTGSTRLDVFRQSGDALSGRFFSFRLLPVSFKEMQLSGIKKELNNFIFSSGFPEPFLAETETDVKRWRRQYKDGIIRNDILNFENIRDLRAMHTLLEMLRYRVGSPISHKSIAEDIGTSPNTISKYIEILESLFIIFRIYPFSKNIARSLKKEAKIYFYDTGLARGNEDVKLENLVAVHLLKHVYGEQDFKGNDTKLYYLRTRDKREVDFCISKEEELIKLIEVKLSDANPSRHLLYFKEKYNIPSTQLVFKIRNERMQSGIDIRNGIKFLNSLNY
ncbi:MAG: ATP-binding protein [Candidatus Cloacimonetes bacterium]|nr:ATP-binding protein [Candidatus Cloacimonadota bacterium]MCF7813967.1 ATP-binding protein [Candidatus Cloacimonadota bacterium]MCF7868811.1 ATP-binding protein [Candidatus Cloacimonadota bacterium]MCF7884070.1 ATP-binding protein [Candidatus Cloacimonadota bacterium]